MEITEQDKRCLELVMMKYGMRIGRDSDGELVFNFTNFDLAGFKRYCETDFRQASKILAGAS